MRPDGAVVVRHRRVFTAASTGISMSRDARAARGASTEAVAVAVHGAGTGRHVTAAGQRLVRTGDLMVVDITRPFDFAWSGPGSSTSIQVPIADLGLPRRRRAAGGRQAGGQSRCTGWSAATSST